MTGVKISQLDAAGTLSGSEPFPVVQGGQTVGALVSQVRDYVDSSLAERTAVAFTVATLAALKALTTRPEAVIVETGQAKGVWQWELGSSTTADDALVVQCTSGTAGRYKRIYDGFVRAEWFGAVGATNEADTSTDAYAGIQAMATWCRANHQPFTLLPPATGSGIWNITQKISVLPPTDANGLRTPPPTSMLDDGARLKAIGSWWTGAGAGQAMIEFGGASSDFSDIVRGGKIVGGTIDGNFLADYCVSCPHFIVLQIFRQHTMNFKKAGWIMGSSSAPGFSGGGEHVNCTVERAVEYKSVTAVTQANPAVVTTSVAHGYAVGDVVVFTTITGMTEIDFVTATNQIKFYTVGSTPTSTTFSLLGIDSTGYTAFSASGTPRVARCFSSMRVAVPISTITNANPGVATATRAHGFTTGQTIHIGDVVGMTGVDGNFTVTVLSATTFSFGVNTTAAGAYSSGGFVFQVLGIEDMQVGVYYKKAVDCDTDGMMMSGVRVGIAADLANAGYDGKHRRWHFANYAEHGELLAAAWLAGDNDFQAIQTDAPFRWVLRLTDGGNRLVGGQTLYTTDVGGLNNYSAPFRLETSGGLRVSNFGFKAHSNAVLLKEVSGTTTEYVSFGNDYDGNMTTTTVTPHAGVLVGIALDIAGNYTMSSNGFIYSYSGGAIGTVRAGFQFDGSGQAIGVYTANTFRGFWDSNGNYIASVALLSSGATSGVGYTTGAGGTVTQGSGSGKATGVTLNKATGLITMDAAALAADTTVSFTLTNSAIAATDTLILNHVSGGTAGAYTLNAQCAGGSASINVRNVTAGSLSEAIVIRFTVIKSVSA